MFNDGAITGRMILEHMQHMETRLRADMYDMKTEWLQKFTGLDNKLSQRIDRLEQRLTLQIDAIIKDSMLSKSKTCQNEYELWRCVFSHNMSHSSSAPATKQDIQMLMEEFAKMYEANRKWRNEIVDTTERWKDEMMTLMHNWKSEIIHEFRIIAEDLRHDAMGAHKDKIQNHENKIVVLEERTGIAA